MTIKLFLFLFITTVAFSSIQAKPNNEIFEPGSDCNGPSSNSLTHSKASSAYTKEMAQQAGTSGTEPDFERFFELFNAKFSLWLDEKNINSSDKASKVYLAMNSAFYAARNNALHASRKAANNPEDNTAFNTALSAVRSAVLYAAMTTYCAGHSDGDKIAMSMKFNATWYIAAAAAEDVMKADLGTSTEIVTKNRKQNKPTSGLTGAMAYRIAERDALICLYEKLFEVLDAAYDAQESHTWKASKSILARTIEKLNGASDAEKQLFSPFTEELRRRVDELPDRKFLGIW